jgi:hypothetical protein
MDLGEKLQAAEVAIGVIGLLITSIGIYLAWHAEKGTQTCNTYFILFQLLTDD